MFSSANMEIVFPGKPQFFPININMRACNLRPALGLYHAGRLLSWPEAHLRHAPFRWVFFLTRSPPSACTVQVSSLSWLRTCLQVFLPSGKVLVLSPGIFSAPHNPTLGHISRQNFDWKRYTYLCSLQHYSQQPRHGNNLSVLWWQMNEEDTVYVYDEILLSIKEN